MPLAGTILEVLLGPKNPFGAHYFQITMADTPDETGQPLLLGLHSTGRYPSYNWIEVIHVAGRARPPEDEVVLTEADVVTLLRYLADIIPPGGHLMVEYESDLWTNTRLSLACSIPAVVTPLGIMLFRAGCGVAFKDWDFAEGGSEGPRKLQGFKALDGQHRRVRAAQMTEDLRAFLSRDTKAACSELWEAARDRAIQILPLLGGLSASAE